ncbi:helix-turn-helix domain-containing protein [Brucella rhizosphaerae]|uniref:helix-turn-helix domain-containing protein n=1 Tax=Brucella rhizosphaerae TaxID=571254 RepID=UPI00360958DE
MSALHSTTHPSRRLSRDETAQIVRDFKDGLSIAAIARKHGIARPTVYRALENGSASRAGAANDVRVYSRLSVEDHAALKAVAETRGLTISALSRSVLRRAAGFFDADPEVAKAALALSRELKKIGSNLNQVVYQINREPLLQGRAAPQPRHLTEIRAMQRTILSAADKVDTLLVHAVRRRLTTIEELLRADGDHA